MSESSNSLATVAGILARNGHKVTAVLHREDLAWEGLETAIPTSISDMLMEVAMDEKGTGRDFDKTAKALGLTGLIHILDEREHANTTQIAHGAIVHGIHNFVDVAYIGYDAKCCIKQMRFGTTSFVYMGTKSEEKLLEIASKPYLHWVKTRGMDWTGDGRARNQNWDDDERPEFDGQEAE
jgi:hypothetical protein